jgi:hypothetical protein
MAKNPTTDKSAAMLSEAGSLNSLLEAESKLGEQRF